MQKTENCQHLCERVDVRNKKGKKVCCVLPSIKTIEIKIGGYITLIQVNEEGEFTIQNI